MALKAHFEIFPLDEKPNGKKGSGMSGCDGNLGITCWDVEVGANTPMKESGEPGDRRRYQEIKIRKDVDDHSVLLAKMLITNTPMRGVLSIYDPQTKNGLDHQCTKLMIEFGHKSGSIDALNGFVSGLTVHVPEQTGHGWGRRNDHPARPPYEEVRFTFNTIKFTKLSDDGQNTVEDEVEDSVSQGMLA